ncbi:hypothetical protein AAC387_Pa07g3412 [Persea americana]
MVPNPLQFQTSLTTNGHLQRALATLYQANGSIDCRACGHLIQQCTNHRLFYQGKQIHARLLLLSITPENFLASKLISFYATTGNSSLARKVFDEIPHTNIFAFNAMLTAYSLHSQHSQVLKLFSSMSSWKPSLKPDKFTVSLLLKSLSSLPSLVHSFLGKEVHAFVLRHGVDVDLFASNGLIAFYARAGELSLARKVFDGMLERDIVSWNSMISGYSQNGWYDEALRLYREMDGLRPDGVTVAAVLCACAELKELAFGMEVHRFVIENGIEMDASAYNSVMGFYAKCGSLDCARALFEEMTKKDEVSYGTMVSAYMTYGLVDEAMELFRQMEKPVLSTWNAVISGLAQNNHHSEVPKLFREMLATGLRPNSVTLASMLPALSFFSNLKGGKQTHCYAVRNCCDRNIYVATALIDTYAKAGFLQGARLVFEVTVSRNLILWTAIISAYAAHGDAGAVLALFGEMLSCGIQPDNVTFTAVLAACAHAGVVEEAWQIFNSMLPKYRIQPMVEHYACIAGALSRAGKLTESVEFISKMPVKPNAKVWGALLNGASIFRNVEVGNFAFNQLFEIEPENAGNYIVMANIYSQAGKWEEAERVREKMERSGVKKFPGCSWIETTKGLNSFISGDTSNEWLEEIYGMLGCLVGVMREEGYIHADELDGESFII